MDRFFRRYASIRKAFKERAKIPFTQQLQRPAFTEKTET